MVVTYPAIAHEPVVGLPCENCEAVFVGLPASIPSRARIAPVGEPGEPMVITGRVVGEDGKPRADVIVYGYHTDARGIYRAPTVSLGLWPDRQGVLRGWARTDAQGQYSFETIRPASYPNRTIPAHVHMHVIEPGCATYYIDEILFTDDPLLTAAKRSGKEGRGGSGITTPTRTGGGNTWRVVRDISLGRAVPGYPHCVSK